MFTILNTPSCGLDLASHELLKYYGLVKNDKVNCFTWRCDKENKLEQS